MSQPKVALVHPYGEVFSRIYESSSGQRTVDVDHYVTLARAFRSRRTAAPVRVLDLGCGAGRTAAALAAAGAHVTAVDSSAAMLARCATDRDAAAFAGRLDLHQADIIDLRLDRKFDLVVIGGLTLSLFLTRELRQRLLSTAIRHLAPEGKLAFDFIALPRGDISASESHSFAAVHLGSLRGFMLVGSRRYPAQRLQLANLYLEVTDRDHRTRRFLTSTSSTLLDETELESDIQMLGASGRFSSLEASQADEPCGHGGIARMCIATPTSGSAP